MVIDDKQILKSIKYTVQQVDPGAQVILYGSRARGEAHANSDWDLLILIDDEPSISDEQKYRHALFDLELDYGQAFSTLVCSRKSWNSKYRVTPLYNNISQEGVYV